MASPDRPTWVPYETIKDCSQGFCSIYCPQWCYIIFPPPPPVSLSEDSSSSPTLSPLVIAVIGILASALLLVAYYALISKYCARLDSLRRRLHGARVEAPPAHDDAPRHEGWYAPAAAGGGLEEAAIKSIGTFKYRRGEGLVDGGGAGDCSVCLGEFREGEGLRLLPKCSHAFHVACIDAWLRSRASCPLCRAAVVSHSAATATPPLLPAPTAPLEPQSSPPPLPESPQDAIAEENVDRGRDGDGDHGQGDNRAVLHLVPKDTSSRSHGEDGIVELANNGAQPIRRSFSMDASRLGRVSVADVLSVDMEAAMAEEGVGSSRGCRAEQDTCKEDGRIAAAGPAAMNRSFSSGRLCFTRQGKGSHGSLLPL